jgi:hypothetical protein
MPLLWDALVVGAGPSGVIAAECLRARGHSVVQIEVGARLAKRAKAPEVDRRMWPYTTVGENYDWYRVRAVGGRSLLWGGWCFRFPDSTLGRNEWPFCARDLAPTYAEIEHRLCVAEGTLDARYRELAQALDLEIIPKRGVLVPAGRSSTPRLLPDRARSHTAALRLEHVGRRVQRVPVFDLRTGTVRQIKARAVVLCASPIETTRILLESDLGEPSDRIGRGFVDHMVASYILLEPSAPPMSGGRGLFPGAALVESFVNLDAETTRPYPGGFSIELSGPLPLESLDIERMAPPGEEARTRATLIHAMGEMTAFGERYVDLDPTRRDVTGRLVPRIHVAFSQGEQQLAADMRQACLQLADALAIPGSRVIPFVDPLQAGAGHEAGTCAMGPEEDSLTDPRGRLRALENVWVADASALPTSGDRHPTLTLLVHARRAAEDAARFLEGAGAVTGEA